MLKPNKACDCALWDPKYVESKGQENRTLLGSDFLPAPEARRWGCYAWNDPRHWLEPVPWRVTPGFSGTHRQVLVLLQVSAAAETQCDTLPAAGQFLQRTDVVQPEADHAASSVGHGRSC